MVFAGRADEFALLERAIRGVRSGEEGHTVVIQGVPGAGKTALLGEFAARLLARGADELNPVIPVKLAATAMDSKPAAIVEEIDSAFRRFECVGLVATGGRQGDGRCSFPGQRLVHGCHSEAPRRVHRRVEGAGFSEPRVERLCESAFWTAGEHDSAVGGRGAELARYAHGAAALGSAARQPARVGLR